MMNYEWGPALEIDIRGKRHPAETRKKPFYKKNQGDRRPASQFLPKAGPHS